MKKSPFLPFLLFATLLLLVGLTPWGAGPRAMEVKVESARFSFDAKKRHYIYEDARVQMGLITVDARTVEVFLEEDRLLAYGDVLFSEGSISGSAEKMELDLKTNNGTFTKAHFYDAKSAYFFSAEELKRTGPGRMVGVQCSLTSCAPGSIGWKLVAGTMNYQSNNFATGTNAWLKVGSAYLFPFPYLAWPTVDQRQSGFLTPQYGYNSSSSPWLKIGDWLKIPFFWAFDEEHDLTLTPQIIGRRGTALTAEYSYAFRQDQKGEFSLFRIKEEKDRSEYGEVTTGFPDAPTGAHKPERHYLNWGHNQGFGRHTRLVMNYATSSDGLVRQEYERLPLYRPHQTYEASISALGGWGNMGLTASHSSDFIEESVFANSEKYSDGRFRPRLAPHLALEAGWRPFAASTLTFSLQGEAAQFVSKSGLSGTASTLTPTVTLPIQLGSAMEVRPSVSRRAVSFQKMTLNNQNFQEVPIAEAGFSQTEYQLEFRWPLSRVFPGREASQEDLKHSLIPRLIYSEVENKAQPFSGAPTSAETGILDTTDTIPPAEELRAGILPQRFSQKMLVLRIDNTWVGRKKIQNHATYQEFGKLNFIQRYNAEMEDPEFVPEGFNPAELETAQGQPLLPAILEGSLAAKSLSLSAEVHYDHQRKSIRETMVSIGGKVNPRSNLSLTYTDNAFTYRDLNNQLHPEQTRLTFSGNGFVSDRILLGFSGSLNLAETMTAMRRLENGGIFLEYNTPCFGLRTTYNEVSSLVGGELTLTRLLLFTFKLGKGLSIDTRETLEVGK